MDMTRTMHLLWRWLLNPPLASPSGTTLIQVMVGSVFVWEAIMKFVFPNTLGAGRFSLLGIPAPAATSPFDAVFEAGCGLLLMFGLLTRLAAIPMIADMVVAILSTKIPLLLGSSLLPPPPVPPQVGFWAMLHAVRSDYAQLMFTAFLLSAGPGVWALDAVLARRSRATTPLTVDTWPLPSPAKTPTRRRKTVRSIGG